MAVSTLLLLAAVICTGVAFISAIAALWSPVGRPAALQFPVAGCALALHTASLAACWLEVGIAPVLGLYEGLSFTAWAILVVYLVIQWRARLKGLGAFLLPVVVGLGLAALLLSGEAPATTPGLRLHWLVLHAGLSFLGLAAFGVVFAVSVMYLLQERSLRRRQASHLGRVLPSLERCDRIIYQALAVGFPLLTLGIFSGFFWAATRGYETFASPKVIFPVLAWVLFAVVLWARFMAGWRGRKMAWAGIGGFLLVMLALLGVGA